MSWHPKVKRIVINIVIRLSLIQNRVLHLRDYPMTKQELAEKYIEDALLRGRWKLSERLQIGRAHV